MAPRLELQAILEELSGMAYFQPPPNAEIVYPCIVFMLDQIDIQHADNAPYKHLNRYQVTVIDRDPDSDIPAKVSHLPTCSFVVAFTRDNLHHTVFTLFF